MSKGDRDHRKRLPSTKRCPEAQNRRRARQAGKREANGE